MKSILTLLLLFALSIANGQSHTSKIDFSQLKIQFEDASAEIIPEYLPLIYRLADTLIKNPKMHVLIKGHVCCVKRNGLAKQRAKTVRYYLSLFGVPEEQMKIKGMKNSEPIVFPERTKKDELTNMRVEFVFTFEE